MSKNKDTQLIWENYQTHSTQPLEEGFFGDIFAISKLSLLKHAGFSNALNIISVSIIHD